MSGGVDSSLAAQLLIEQGYEVCGLTMRQFDAGAYSGGGYHDAAADAAKVASHLHIPHYIVDTRREFGREVVDCFVSEYAAGRTPNPCVRCNRRIKFDLLLKKAIELGCDFLATGHYARIENNILHKGIDISKDQSYFLYVLYECDISRILFPLGALHKSQTRKQAAQAGLPSASRSESQDICFIPDNDHAGFLRRKLPMQKGPIVDTSGKQIGVHDGLYLYTIGQRKGLGAQGRRMFVKEIHPETNTIVAADDEHIVSTNITVSDFVKGPFDIASGDRFFVQIRYRSSAQPAIIASIDDNAVGIAFESPARAVAPGQAAVIYDNDMIVGGGTIESSS